MGEVDKGAEPSGPWTVAPDRRVFRNRTLCVPELFVNRLKNRSVEHFLVLTYQKKKLGPSHRRPSQLDQAKLLDPLDSTCLAVGEPSEYTKPIGQSLRHVQTLRPSKFGHDTS